MLQLPRPSSQPRVDTRSGLRQLTWAAVLVAAPLLAAGCGEGSFGAQKGPNGPSAPTNLPTPPGLIPPPPNTPVPPPPPVAPPPVVTPPTVDNPVPPPTMTPPPPLPSSPARPGIPQPVSELLERRCFQCHQPGQRDPSGWGSVLDLSRMISADIVVPGDLSLSRMWYRVAVRNDMPFNGARLTPEEKGLIQQWILEMNRPVSVPRTQEDILQLLVQDNRLTGGNRSDIRYLSFAHFVDEGRTPEDLKPLEGMTNVILNSLSRRPGLIRVTPIDKEGTIFKFRIGDLGWSAAEWDELVRFYPYCERSNKAEVRQLYNRLDTEAPFVRGDWFFSTATLQPLYGILVDQAQTRQELEAQLDINLEQNVLDSKVQRIGMDLSGVSQNQRIIERHILRKNEYFWWSYDFADRLLATSDIRKNPLGPTRVTGDKFQRTFDEAGGEAIYSLPNGMQGYFLTNAAGTFLAEAPTVIVQDPRRKAGAVQTALSCFTCHQNQGMIFPKTYDDIVKFAEEHRGDFNDAEIAEVRKIYPRNGVQTLRADSARFLQTQQLLGPSVTSLIESSGKTEWDPWVNVVSQYESKIGLRGGAIELGLSPAQATQLFRKADGNNEDALPLQNTQALIQRNEFQCKYRVIVGRDVRRNVEFCRGTFDEPSLTAFCDQVNAN